MLVKELFMERPDGVKLFRTFSDIGMYILQVDTGIKYEDAVDVEDSTHQYEETDEPISREEEEINAYDD